VKQNNFFIKSKIVIIGILILGYAVVYMPCVEKQEDVESLSNENTKVTLNTYKQEGNVSLSLNQINTNSESGQTQQFLNNEGIPLTDEGFAVAAVWENGELRELTYEEVAEFEQRLYSCQTIEEYEAVLATIAYYNRGIDMSRFPWYWDEMSEMYTDEQIAMMKNRPDERRAVVNVVGLPAMQAYNNMINAGFIVKLIYEYNEDSDLPVDYCYKQDVPYGTMWNINAVFGLHIQAPKGAGQVVRNPEDEDFSIEDVAQQKEDGVYQIEVPNVIGMQELAAKNSLINAGLSNVVVRFKDNGTNPDGICIEQSISPGTMAGNGDSITIFIQQGCIMYEVPNVIGMQEAQAVEKVKASGLNYKCEYISDPNSNIAKGCCIRLEFQPGSFITKDTTLTIFIQTYETTDIPSSTDAPIPTDAPTSTPDPSTSMETSEIVP